MSIGDSSSKTTSNATQTTTQNPYAPAVPSITDLLKSLNTFQSGNTAPSSTTTDALGQLIDQAKQGNPLAPGAMGATSSQLNATTQPQQSTADNGYADYVKRMSPVADGVNSNNVMDNPQVAAAVAAANQDAMNGVQQSFAAAGRSNSGLEQGAIAHGITAATAPILLNELNTQQARSDAAAGNLNAAATNNATTDAGLKTTQAGIQSQGIANEPAALTAQQWGPAQVAQLSQTLQNLPLDQMTQIANLLFPAAQLGGTTTGNKTGTSKTSGFSLGFKI